MAPKHGLNGAL